MRRSELAEIGQYRLTPDNWGQNSVMLDEEEVGRLTAEAFGMDPDQEDFDPDSDPNNRPEHVMLSQKKGVLGEYYVIREGFRAGGTWHKAIFCQVENLDEVSGVLVGQWEEFEEEE